MYDDSFDRLKALREAMVDLNQKKASNKKCRTCRYIGKRCNLSPCNKCSEIVDWCGLSEWVGRSL